MNFGILGDHCIEEYSLLLRASGSVMSSYISKDYKEIYKDISYKVKAGHGITKEGTSGSCWRQFQDFPGYQKCFISS